MHEHFLAVHDQKNEETNQIYKCSLCEMGFSSKETMDQHFWVVHQAGQKQGIENVVNEHQFVKLPFKCSVCDLDFAHEYGLQYHMNKVHDRKNPGINVISSYNQSDMKITIKSVQKDLKSNINRSSDTGTVDLFFILYKEVSAVS